MLQMISRRPWISRALWIFIALALLGVLISTLMFAQWSEIEALPMEDASARFEDILKSCEDQRPYVSILADGKVLIDRSLESSERRPLTTFHVYFWEKEDERLFHSAIPFWFVKIKMSRTLNLGTIASFIARDLSYLDLRITDQDLKSRGPGLVLDYAFDGGDRLILRTD